MPRGLSTPTIVVNNVSVKIKPNSLKWKAGFANIKVRVASGGGNRVENVTTKDLETQRGSVAFTLYSTSENINLKDTWQENEDTNVVEWLERGETRRMGSAVVVEDPEVTHGVEGEFEVMFEGDKLV